MVGRLICNSFCVELSRGFQYKSIPCVAYAAPPHQMILPPCKVSGSIFLVPTSCKIIQILPKTIDGQIYQLPNAALINNCDIIYAFAHRNNVVVLMIDDWWLFFVPSAPSFSKQMHLFHFFPLWFFFFSCLPTVGGFLMAGGHYCFALIIN